MTRLIRYARSIASARRHRIPLTRWNLRALWHQSEPGWQDRLWMGDLNDDMSDAEFEAFLKEISS